jgi:flagellar protein FliT
VNRVQALYDQTVKLLDLLENKSGMDRDEKIKQIQELLELREIEINRLNGAFTDQEQELGAKLVNLNNRLTLLLEREKMVIQKDIKDLQTRKESNQKYINPYEGFSTGGVFYDKRN